MKKDESIQKLAQRFISIVEDGFQYLLRTRIFSLLLSFFTVLLLGILLGGVSEYLFYLPSAVKMTLVSLSVLAAAGITIYLYGTSQLPDFKAFYKQFSRQRDIPQLTDALDLYYEESGGETGLSRAAIRQNLASLDPKNLSEAVTEYTARHRLYRMYRTGLKALGAVLLLLVAFASLKPDAMSRFADLGTTYTPPNPYDYTIEPGSVTMEQGQSFTPGIRFEEETPENLALAFKTNVEEEYRQRQALQMENGHATFSSVSLTANGSYYFVMDGFESQKHTVSVQLRPRFEQLRVSVIPPSYTGLDSSSYSYPFSQIRAYRGSQLRLRGETNKPIEKLSLRRSAIDSSFGDVGLGGDARSYTGEWEVTRTDTVSFQMVDSAGLSNKNSFRFVIQPREDQAPFVNLISPSQNMKMKQAEPVQLVYEAGDDFGLTSAVLRYELRQAFADEPRKGSVNLGRPAMNARERYSWQVPKINPKPRDVLTYWIAVTDNDAYSGNKVGRSQKMTITFPSMTEYMDELESQETEVSEELDRISDSFERMEREYDQFKESLKKNPETSWEQKKQLQQVDEERKKIDEQVNALNEKFEKLRKEIEQNRPMSQETMEAYQELQKLMKEINDPELAKALEELQKSLGEMSPQQMRKALENYEFNEELYRERINRTKELFKSLKLNSDLDKLAKSLEELAKQEEEISESEQPASEDLKQQEAVKNDLENLQEQMEELGESAPQKAREQVRELQNETRKQMNRTRKELEQNMEKLRQQEGSQKSGSQIRQQQQRIQKQMQQMAQQMNSAKQQLNRQQKRINLSGLEYILYSLINLSINQEELTKETENLPPRDQGFVEKARKQQNISQQFTTLSDSLFQLSSDIPTFSNQINSKKAEVEKELKRAVTMLSERNKSNSTFAQRQSLGGINDLATMIASLIDQLQNQQGGGAGGAMSMQQMIEQIQKMSGQQQKLNEQIQQMINDMQGNRLSQSQMERLNQLSKQQNRIRKQLKELQRRGELDSGDRVLSELERMSEQMEDAINDLRGGQLNEQLMQRQQNILSRMLSAQKAVQERGKKDERAGTTAEEQQQATPPDITLEELQQRIRKMLNDPERTEYTEDYQRLIEQYFELLKERRKQIMR